MSTDAGSVNSHGEQPRHPVAATLSSIALVLAVVAFFPAMVSGVGVICFVTAVVALVLFRVTPRLAVATLYWSGATIAVSPWLWNIPGNLLAPIVWVGVALLVLLLVHYLRAGRTP